MPDQTSARGLHGLRYLTKDVARSMAFYEKLGFKVVQQQLPMFATVAVGPLNLLLTGPGASGSRPLPDGRAQEPGGFNRLVIQTTGLAAQVEDLKKAGVRLRTEPASGPFGTQVQIEDRDGNPIELFEPAQRS